jgi:4-hydroxybenzoate polyprenyltransferase
MAWLRIVRPFNGLLAVASLMVAIYLANGELQFYWRESLALFLVVCYGYVVNDLFDRRTDAISKPQRVLPSGDLSSKAAIGLAVGCIAAALVLAAWSGLTAFMYISVLALLLFHYAFSISAMPLLGNLLVALLASSVFYLGGMIAGGDERGWQLLFAATILSFLHHLGREIVKDMEDAEGDRQAGRKTIPIAWGGRAAQILTGVALALLVGSTYLFAAWLDLGVWFLIVVSIAVNLPLLVIYFGYVRPDDTRRLRLASLAYKLTMLPSLLALVLARALT